MSAKPPRFLPTVALAVLWVVLYFVWLAVRPAPDRATTRPAARAAASSSTTTTAPALFKLKP